ncbi:MAG: homoserine dehydrogenase [Eubacteriaceae bacterium]|nr:homoserine dehydrogenase [Eubacteriaceae bacterium]
MKLGLLGFGTIGTGVYELINLNKGQFQKNIDEKSVITKILDRDPTKQVKDPDSEIVTDVDVILNDPEIKIVISLMGGMDFEYEQIKAALQKGKHVVTANKAVISEYFKELTEIAIENNVYLRYEASVGGGIPLIETLKEETRINRVNEIKGILNGTTNYILSQMTSEGADFDEALKDAQAIGFAEADPTADVDGFDVSRKLAILSSLAYGGIVKDEDIAKRSLRSVRAVDIEMAQDNGYNIKYLGHSYLDDHDFYGTVEPVLFKQTSIMSHVHSEFNIISITGDIIGELQFYGKGAGKDATANAVVGDVLYIINAMKEEISPKPTRFKNRIEKMGNGGFTGSYYIRVNVDDNEMLERAVGKIDTIAGRKELVISDGHFFAWTRPVDAASMNALAKEIESITENYFYARIYE